LDPEPLVMVIPGINGNDDRLIYTGSVFSGVDPRTNELLQVPLSPRVDWPVLQRLYGNHFLRMYYGGNGGDRLIVERYHLFDGSSAGFLDLPLNVDSASFMMAMNPYDSTFYLAYVDLEGIAMIHLDSLLRPLAPAAHVGGLPGLASMPAVLIANDSLFVAWEDRRSGHAEIYGLARSLRPEAFVSDDFRGRPSAGPSAPSVAVAPVPTAGAVHLLVTGLHGMLTIDVIDPIGRVVDREQDAGGISEQRMLTLNLERLVPGAYTVVVHGRDGFAAAPLLVTR
jgi:hypothetical protein